MKKRSMHKLHIGENIWKWYFKNHSLVIFAPTGKRYEISSYDIVRLRGIKGTDSEIEDMFDTGSIDYKECSITPALVKTYISDKLISITGTLGKKHV